MIKHGQEMCYGDDRVCGSELGVVHYEKMAEALGGYGEFVDRDEDIAPAIQRALSSGKPACIKPSITYWESASKYFLALGVSSR